MKRLIEQGIGTDALLAYLPYRLQYSKDLPRLNYLESDVLQWDAEGRPAAPKPRGRGAQRPIGEPTADAGEIRAAMELKRQRQEER